MGASNMVEGLAFVMYSVKDLTRARHFYEGDLGLAQARISQGA